MLKEPIFLIWWGYTLYFRLLLVRYPYEIDFANGVV